MEPREKIRARLLYAEGYTVDDIAEALGADKRDVILIASAEDRQRERDAKSLDRLHRQRRSLAIRREELVELLDKYRQLLPDQISKNGQQQKHFGMFDQYFALSTRVAVLDRELAKLDDQLLAFEQRSLGPASQLPALTLDINTSEHGDFPTREGEVLDVRDGDDD